MKKIEKNLKTLEIEFLKTLENIENLEIEELWWPGPRYNQPQPPLPLRY